MLIKVKNISSVYEELYYLICKEKPINTNKTYYKKREKGQHLFYKICKEIAKSGIYINLPKCALLIRSSFPLQPLSLDILIR